MDKNNSEFRIFSEVPLPRDLSERLTISINERISVDGRGLRYNNTRIPIRVVKQSRNYAVRDATVSKRCCNSIRTGVR